MSVRGPNNIGRAVQADPTLLLYASEIREQKKCWELLAEKFDWFQTLRDNTQQHPTTCNRVCKRTQHVTSNNVGSCWPTMLRRFARGLRLLSCILSKDDNLILGYPFWSQPLWYVVNFMKKVLSCKSRHITILIQRLYMSSIIRLELGIISELSGVRFLLLLNDIYPLYQCLLFLLNAGRRLIQNLISGCF